MFTFLCMSLYTLYGTMTASISLFCPYTQDPFHLFEEGATMTNLLNLHALLSAGLNASLVSSLFFLRKKLVGLLMP